MLIALQTYNEFTFVNESSQQLFNNAALLNSVSRKPTIKKALEAIRVPFFFGKIVNYSISSPKNLFKRSINPIKFNSNY